MERVSTILISYIEINILFSEIVPHYNSHLLNLSTSSFRRNRYVLVFDLMILKRTLFFVTNLSSTR